MNVRVARFAAFAWLAFALAAGAAAATPAVAVFTRPVDGPEGPWQVEVAAKGRPDCRVYDAKGRLVAGPFAAKNFIVHDVTPWSAEDPVCYRLVVEEDGRREESLFAFSERAIVGDRFFVNGRPVRLKVGPRAWNGNTVSALDCSREEALAEGLYRIPATQLARLARLEPLTTPGATRHRFQDWSVRATNAFSRLVVENRSAFRDGSDVELKWTLLRDGRKIDSGEIDLLRLKPGCTTELDMPPEAIAARFDEGTVSLRFAFIRAGETIAEDQIELVASREPELFGVKQEGWFGSLLPDWFKAKVAYDEVAEADGRLVRRFTTGRTIFTAGVDGGGCIGYVKRGIFSDTSLIERVLPWREALIPSWSGAFAFDLPPSAVGSRDGALTFTDYDENGPVQAGCRWTVLPDGSVSCQARLRSSARHPGERLGLYLALGTCIDRIEWFGCGPWSNGRAATEGNFPGRWAGEAEGAFLGRWTADAGELFSAEGTRGIRLGELTIRTLGAPFAFRLVDGRHLELAGEPDEEGVVELSFTLSVGDGDLTARTPAYEADLPDFPDFEPTSNGSEMK